MSGAAAPGGVDLFYGASLLAFVLVGALPPFAILVGVVWFSRSSSPSVRAVASLLALVFLGVSVLSTLASIVPTSESFVIGLAAAVAVGLSGLALTLAVSLPKQDSRVAGLSRRSSLIVAASLVLGLIGLILFPVLDAPVRQISIYQGIGPGNSDTFEVWFRLRNQLPMAISILAACLGATAWRTTGRLSAAVATAFGSVAIGVNLLQLFLQTGD